MSAVARYWIQMGSHLGFLAILAWLPAGLAGRFVSALAGASQTGVAGLSAHAIGSVFGFCVVFLLVLGAVSVPLELLGLVRFYRRIADDLAQARAYHRKVLLITVAVLSWGGVVSLGAVFSLFLPS